MWWKRHIKCLQKSAHNLGIGVRCTIQEQSALQKPTQTVPPTAPTTSTLLQTDPTDSNVADMVMAYANAARDRTRLGFDCAEMQGAHVYLITEFFLRCYDHSFRLVRRKFSRARKLYRRRDFLVQSAELRLIPTFRSFCVGLIGSNRTSTRALQSRRQSLSRS